MNRWWLRLSLRARLLLVGVLGLAVALAVGSVALYSVLSVVTFRSLDGSASATASEVAALVDSGRLPDPIPATGDQVVQVLDSSNRVVSASADADRLTSLVLPGELSAALGGGHPLVPGSRAGRDSDLRVTAVRAGPADARRTVVVAYGFQDLQDSRRVLARTLLITYPLLLVVLALIASRVIAAALRPVEQLRSAADRISGTGQDARLPVPESHDEIHDLAVTLNSMLDRLASARARQRSFVADAAHELRSPLASMLTQLDVADHLGEGGGVTPDLRAEVERMSGLVESLLVLARLDREPGADPAVAVPLAPLVADAVRRPAAVRLTKWEVPDVAVLAPADHVHRVLDNLLDNAVRHARSEVVVSASVEAGTVHLLVDDDGAGIRPEDRERVFDRFTRLDEARARDAGGSGLGLAIVRELVERDGGHVDLDTAPLGGLRVRVTWCSADTA
ncbi:MAG: HAMP domain-containing histidine kinase [Marmoricola sp.]|nr:HAMP domain-containing histidine kinase [Marmoricola sp.]